MKINVSVSDIAFFDDFCDNRTEKAVIRKMRKTAGHKKAVLDSRAKKALRNAKRGW